jgi:hypothetical protein
MDNDNALVHVTPDDIAFLEQELSKTPKPAPIRELAEKLAFRKTADQRIQEVKLYDPACVYLIGDSIYKEYDEPLTVSSKTVEPFKGAVVLTVVHKTLYKGLGEMLEVDYIGGGIFRKYIDYMKKSKTQVLLPSNTAGTNAAPKSMGRENDPRLTELPMTDKDLKALERSLRTALLKSPIFFAWGDRFQLTAHQPVLPEEKIREIEAHITATKESAATADLVRLSFGLEPSSDLFDITCLALAHYFETKRKKEFLSVSPLDWGKWHLKSVLNLMPENLAVSVAAAPLVEFESPELPEPAGHEFPLKVYLSWREIVSGAVKIPKPFHKELAHSREYVFTDADDNKSHIVYYYPTQGFFLGLKAFFAAHNIPQGTSLTLERKGPTHFHFRLKKSKKKISVAKMAYDPASDMFTDVTEAATLAMPNKIIYLERETLQKLVAHYPEREGLNLKDLLVLVFKNFSAATAGHALHYLRAYHLVDVLKQTLPEDVELILLNSPEFSKSDKKKGIYAYHEALPVPEEIPVEAEIEVEAPVREVVDAPGTIHYDEFEALPEEAPIDVIQQAEEEEVEVEAPPAAPPQPLPAKPAAGAPAATTAGKKEKPYKKKKGKSEGEKQPRAGKSERRVIEERLEAEESERDALRAEKAVDGGDLEDIDLIEAEPEPAETEVPAAPTARPKADEAEEAVAAAEAEEAQAEAAPAAPAAGGMFGNLFAERLKNALAKKRQESAENKVEEKSEEKE